MQRLSTINRKDNKSPISSLKKKKNTFHLQVMNLVLQQLPRLDFEDLHLLQEVLPLPGWRLFKLPTTCLQFPRGGSFKLLWCSNNQSCISFTELHKYTEVRDGRLSKTSLSWSVWDTDNTWVATYNTLHTPVAGVGVVDGVVLSQWCTPAWAPEEQCCVAVPVPKPEKIRNRLLYGL